MVDSRKASCQGGVYAHKYLRLIDKKFYLEEFYPEGLCQSLQRFTDLPVVITENGCSADDDRFRIVFIAQYLSSLHDAISRGVDLDGYIYWSTMDNYEWGSYTPRFGLVEVNRSNFSRSPKPSARFFKDIIEENGFSGETVRRYLSELPVT